MKRKKQKLKLQHIDQSILKPETPLEPKCFHLLFLSGMHLLINGKRNGLGLRCHNRENPISIG